MDSTSRIPETEALAGDSAKEPRVFLAPHPNNVPITGPSAVREGKPESAQVDSGAEPLQSLARGAAPSSGSSEVPRPDQAAEQESDAPPLSTAKRDEDANVERASRVSVAPRGTRTDKDEAVASDPSRRKDDGSHDQMRAAIRPGTTAVIDGKATKADDPGPSVIDSGVEKDGEAERRRSAVGEGTRLNSVASEPGERETNTRSSAKLPAKPHHWSTSDVASAKKLHPSGIIIILLYVGIVITLVVLTIALFTKNSAQQAQACTTSECHEYATLLASSVDASVSPCNSFARFVCGRWERSNALSVREFLYERALDRMTSHIRTVEVPDSGQNDVQRAAAAFRSCEDVLNGRVDHLDTVKRTLGDAGITWPRFPNRVNVLRTLLFSSLKLAWDVLLRVVPRCSGNTTTLTMNPGRHFYRIVEMATNSLSQSEFKVYFNTLRNAFGSGRSDDNEASFAETAVLDKITSLTLVSKYHLGTSSPVPLDVPRDAGTEWLATLVHFGYNTTAEVALVTTNPSFVGTFLDVWRRIGGNSTHLLISWSTVQVAALYANKDLILNYYGGKTEVASVRYTAFCFSTAYLLSRGAPFARYEGETVSKEARANADAVMRSVSSAYIRRLSKWPHFKEDIKVVADWLALPSEAFHEAHVLATDDSCHGDGDKFPDLTDSLPYNWHSSSRLISNIPDDFYDVVRAISSLELSVPSSRSKTLRLLPLSLWFPLFDLGLPSAINYAGIGGQVGSALSWLLASAYAGDSRTAEVIANLSACVERHSSSAVQLDSALSQALTAGPLVDAYEHGTAARDGRVGAYGGTQLLFVALCFFACAGRGNVVEGAVCDLAMRQSREFARVFKCAPGAPMNPKERCDLP